jgi:hypothetical protein
VPDLGAVIDDFLGRPRPAAERRELRSALAHVALELGEVDVAAVRPAQVMALVDHLQDSGLSTERLGSVVDALRAVYAYAIESGLVRTSPVLGMGVAPEHARGASTPTDAVLALGERMVAWTVGIIAIAFIAVAVLLGVAIV